MRIEAPVVTIVDEDPAVRSALSALFEAAGWASRTFATGREFLASPRVVRPGCLILEATLPDIGGLELQQRVADRPELPVIFLAHQQDVATTVRAMKAGAIEVLTKPIDSCYLLSAIQTAIEQSTARIAREAQLQALQDRLSALTQRERQVMSRVVAGYLNKQVAAELDISEITVKAHRGKVMRKMQAGSLAQLIGMAAELRVGVSQREAHADLEVASDPIVWHAREKRRVDVGVDAEARMRWRPIEQVAHRGVHRAVAAQGC